MAEGPGHTECARSTRRCQCLMGSAAAAGHCSLGSLCPSREAHDTPEASSETPAGQREANSHTLCLSEKKKKQ